jgi:hypothetical protein
MADPTGHRDDDSDPRRELLELSDRDPEAALGWIGRLNPDTARDPVVQMAKILACRRIALGAPGEKSGTDYRRMFSDEELAALRDALAAIKMLQETQPDYFEEQTDGHDPSHPISTVLVAAEGVWPGSVQSHLGWTRIGYFHGKQFGFAPSLYERIPRAVLDAVYARKLRDLPLFKSAFAISFAGSAERLSIWLLEKDLRYTENIGAAGTLGTLVIASDGSYQFTPQGSDMRGDATVNSDSLEPNETENSVPWIWIVAVPAILWFLFSCAHTILS